MTVPRDSVPADCTWNEGGAYSTVEAWEAELESVLADLAGLTAFGGRIGESASALVDALEARDAITRRSGQVFVYAMLGYAVETTDAAAVARFGRARAADAQVVVAAAFVEPEVLAVGADRLREWAASEPTLAAYEHYLTDLGRREAHTRSSEVEEVLGLVSDVFVGPSGVYRALTDSDLSFEPAVAPDATRADVTQGSIDMLLASSDRTLRRSAWESYADGYLGVRNTLAAHLAGTEKQAVFQYATGISGAHALARGVLDGAETVPQAATSSSSPSATRAIRSTRSSVPASTCGRPRRWSRRSWCSPRPSIGSRR